MTEQDFLEFEIRPKMDRTLKETIDKNIKGITGKFKKIGNSVSGVGTKIKENFSGESFKNASDGAESLLNSLTPIMATLGGIAAFSGGINIASDFYEETGKLETAFGSQSEVIKKFINDLDEQFGIGVATTTSFVAGVGTKLKGLGVAEDSLDDFTKNIVSMSMDMAEAFHLDPGQMTEALSMALTGQTKALKQFGIVIDEANLKKELLGKGINFENLDEAQKATVMMNEINKQLSKTGLKGARMGMIGSFETAIESLQARLKDLAAISLSGLTQSLAEPTMALSNLVKGSQEGFKQIADGIGNTISDIFSYFKTLEEPILNLIDSVNKFGNSLNFDSSYFEIYTNIIKDAIDTILVEFTSFFDFLSENNEGITSFFELLASSIEFVYPALKLFFHFFMEGLKAIIGIANLVFKALEPLFDMIKKLAIDYKGFVGKIFETLGMKNTSSTIDANSLNNLKNIESNPVIPESGATISQDIKSDNSSVSSQNNIVVKVEQGNQELAKKIEEVVKKTADDHARQKELEYGVI